MYCERLIRPPEGGRKMVPACSVYDGPSYEPNSILGHQFQHSQLTWACYHSEGGLQAISRINIIFEIRLTLWNSVHIMVLGVMNRMIPPSLKYFKYWWNGANILSSMRTFDKLFLYAVYMGNSELFTKNAGYDRILILKNMFYDLWKWLLLLEDLLHYVSMEGQKIWKQHLKSTRL